MKIRLGSILVLGLLVVLASVRSPSRAGSKTENASPGGTQIHFNQDIRPILSQHCFKCHGPDLKKGGLNFQNKETVFNPLKSGNIPVVPGKSAESELIRRVSSPDEDERMPPKGKGEWLTPEKIAKLRAWIDQGAKWEEHWAYVKPVGPPLPDVKNKAWVRNGIDYFVLARLEKEGLGPSPEADRATLIRRASLDLTGLPPTLQEVDAFLADKSPDAYEKVVDRLLASPHYGERQAHPWLDEARYADTNGYEKDDRRTIWPYRDWVINAFNRDLPFDQFTIEQIAGDLFPNATLEQKIATGFQRNTMVNTEGGTDDEEFRIAAIVDRVNTTMEVWLGTTMGCAQCHNHKFDPFTQVEYYRLFAFFNNTEDRGGNNEPTVAVPTKEGIEQRKKIEAEIAQLQKVLDMPTPELTEAQTKWELQVAPQKVVWTPLDPVSMVSANGAAFTKHKDGTILVAGKSPESDTYTITVKTNLTGISAFRLEVLPDKSLPKNGPGRADNGNFVLNKLRITATAKAGSTQPVALQNASADFSQADWPVDGVLGNNPKAGWAVAPQVGQRHLAVFETKENSGSKEATTLTFVLEQNFGYKHTIGKLRLVATTATRPVRASDLPDNIVKILSVAPGQRSATQREELAKYYRSMAPELAAVRQRLAALRTQEANTKPATTTLVLKELAKPRQTHVLIRGNHKRQGEEVSAGVPAKLHGLPGGQPVNRLALARWLVDPNNPLVGRVTMNRIWAQYFGRGLVETSEDFGVKGEPPTHPELLDWLAKELLAQKWTLKAMHKLIVMSATYRQSSRVTRELHERDPFNRLFARGPRFRMDAEMVRDNALAISGLLSRKIGGPSVFPYQPEGVWNNPYSSDKWVVSTGGDQYRRGLYTFWRRTAPYAAFVAFDAPSREVCTERRPRTNTPLQALATLNDRVYVESAAALARRLMAEVQGSEKDRAIHAFRLCVARSPSAPELDQLMKLYRESLDKYRNDPAAAKALATSGLSEPPKEMDNAALAAWTIVANVLLNLDETVTKG